MTEHPRRRSDRKRPARAPRTVRPRTIAIAALAIIAVVAAAVALSVFLDPEPPGRVRLVELSRDSTATVGFAGMFPAEDAVALANPLGIVWDGERLFVAESDAGVIRIFDAEGGELGRIAIPAAGDASAAYPSVLAIAGERLAIVENAGNRVLVVGMESTDNPEVLLVLGAAADAPIQPTAVAYGQGEFFVADAADATIKVYDDEGSYQRSLGVGITPGLGFVGAIAVTDGRLLVADSNAGRVLVLDPETGDQSAVFADRYALPRAIDLIGDDRLVVVDAFERAAYIAMADGTRVDTVDAESVPDGALSSPRGVAWLGEDSRLYVTDGGLGRVMVYNVRLGGDE